MPPTTEDRGGHRRLPVRPLAAPPPADVASPLLPSPRPPLLGSAALTGVGARTPAAATASRSHWRCGGRDGGSPCMRHMRRLIPLPPPDDQGRAHYQVAVRPLAPGARHVRCGTQINGHV